MAKIKNKKCEKLGVMKIEVPVLKFEDNNSEVQFKKIHEEFSEVETEVFDMRCGLGKKERLLEECFDLITATFTLINLNFTEDEIKAYSSKNVKKMFYKFGKKEFEE